MLLNGYKSLAFREPFWSLFAENVDCRKFPWLWEIFLIAENFLDCGKVTFLTVEKIIGLIILKTNTNNEIIKTHILDLEQKLSSVVFLC